MTSRAAGAGVWLRLFLCMAARAYLVVLASLGLWALAPKLLGWETVVVMSGSMEPKVRPGDALVFQPRPASDLPAGQVIIVHDPAAPGRLLSHRLVKRLSNGQLVTKGDANAGVDSTLVKPAAVLGLAQLRVPYIGLLWKWLHERRRVEGILALALTLVAVVAAAGDPDQPERQRGERATSRRRSRFFRVA